jgi:pimeloyl-ACP methyl ester carboxylesterase
MLARLRQPRQSAQSEAGLLRRLLPWFLAGLWAAAAAAAPPATLRVGQLILQRCDTPAPWCGRLTRRLDPDGSVPGTLDIYFEYFPHSGAGPAAGTLVAAEGGPGYPTTGSRADYLALFTPLRDTHDVLLMDDRGTGRSGALDCEPLQRAQHLTAADIGACGRSLGPRAHLYSTTLAADDLAAVLDALAIARVDLYGDSYGSYFSQVFALRHADRLRSLVLDGAYPLEGPDYAWYPHYAPATRAKFNLACERSPGCQAVSGSSIEHMLPALQELRAHPFDATVMDDTGHAMSLRADASALAIVLFGGSPAYATVREADAATRAFSAGDHAPLLRLMAESLGSVDSRDPTRSPALFSSGLAMAVICQDPPLVFDLALDLPRRAAMLERESTRIGQSLPGLYAPFTLKEYLGMPPDYAFIDECLQWPIPAPGAPVPPLVVPHSPYPDIPVLVVSGELDNMTSVADGEAAASHWPHARHVIIANSFHVNALPHARSECGAALVRTFLSALALDDGRCAMRVPPVPLVTNFARAAEELDPARATAGNQADVRQLRQVSAAWQTSADVLARAREHGPGTLVGLRGGSFRVEPFGNGYRLRLRAVRWTEDLEVWGRIEWPGGRNGPVRASLKLKDTAGAASNLDLQWPSDDPGGVAVARGRIGGSLVRAAVPLS